MKKYFNASFFFRLLGWLILSVIVLYTLFIVFYNVYAPAEVFYEPFSVEYNGETYIVYEDKEPYRLIADDSIAETENRVYVKNMIVPFIYFEPYSIKFDENASFIWLYYFDEILVKDNFVFPTVEKDTVNEVWMSASSTGKYKIKDEKIVDKIVECAKNKGELELDKDIVDYIKMYSYDNHCFSLKYEGYPILEKFYIEETEDGKYIVNQYTEEDFDMIFGDPEAH